MSHQNTDKAAAQSEMDKLREELLNDPKVRIGQNVLRDRMREKAERQPE